MTTMQNALAWLAPRLVFAARLSIISIPFFYAYILTSENEASTVLGLVGLVRLLHTQQHALL